MTTDTTPAPETFTFGPYVWDVAAALTLAEGLPEQRLELAGCFAMLPLIGIDPGHAATVDLTRPVLVVHVQEMSDAPLLIDGWHRVARARDERLTTLPCRVLDADQEFQVRIYGGRKGLTPLRRNGRRRGRGV